jgi:hypothetical protein
MVVGVPREANEHAPFGCHDDAGCPRSRERRDDLERTIRCSIT